MLGPTKWRLLTIVAGILLAHAIESPTSKGNKLNAQVRSFTNPELGLRIEQISPWSTGRNIPARNLLVPHQLFSRVDNIRYIDSRTPNSRHLQSTFGAFRIADQQQTPSSDGLQRRRSKAFQMRRSDEAGVDAGLPLEKQPAEQPLDRCKT
uniref:Secreted protein n=1 Tax=Anopheles coluzzii TaxID=1518534 RepID=A0A8W7PZR6_ANOCL